MNRIALAIVAFACAAVGASMIRDDYQDGRMRLFFGTINPFVFRHDTNPGWFLGATIVNLMSVALLVVGGIAALAVGSVQ